MESMLSRFVHMAVYLSVVLSCEHKLSRPVFHSQILKEEFLLSCAKCQHTASCSPRTSTPFFTFANILRSFQYLHPRTDIRNREKVQRLLL